MQSITLAQLNPTVGDIGGNADKILEAWKNCNSDLIIFPELFLCGYPPEDLVTRPSFIRACETAIKQIVIKSAQFTAGALVTCPISENGKVYNGALLIEHGKIIASVRKYHLPNYGVFEEMRVFASAPLPEPIKFRGITLGIMICEDMWFPNVAAHLKAHGAEILIVPNGSPFDIGKTQIRRAHARSRIQETGLPLFYINLIGGQDEIVFDGASFVMDARGEIVSELKAFEEEIKTLSLPLRGLPLNEGIGIKNEALPDIYKALTLGLRDYVRKNNFPGILIGLSGGIDSALVAMIAADALGPENVHCVMMPSQFTSRDSIEDAAALAKNIGVRLDTISIDPPVAAFNEIIREHTIGAPETTFENLQSRARGMILMALSNATGKMVLSTGNKSEMAVGYATLYGDMCGGFNPIKDVYKTMVYDLARERNINGIIPERIFTKAPTAELKPNQTDQDTLPPYSVLDSILKDLIENELSEDDIVAKGHDAAIVRRVTKMLKAAEYKRRQAPPGVKITTKSFGRERRYPITNRF
jgi:NAD+ synthase